MAHSTCQLAIGTGLIRVNVLDWVEVLWQGREPDSQNQHEEEWAVEELLRLFAKGIDMCCIN